MHWVLCVVGRCIGKRIDFLHFFFARLAEAHMSVISSVIGCTNEVERTMELNEFELHRVCAFYTFECLKKIREISLSYRIEGFLCWFMQHPHLRKCEGERLGHFSMFK